MFEYPEAPCPLTLPMTPERMLWCLDVIGWPNVEVADRLGIASENVSRMARGKRNIPNRVAFWLETLAAAHLAFPLPIGWADGRDVGARNHAATNERQRAEAEQRMIDGETDEEVMFERAWTPMTKNLAQAAE